jgi:enoyl-CoA hydratase
MKPAVVRLERRGSVALLTLDHAPVNSLSQPVRRALWDALVTADEDTAVRAIVLTGAGRGFCAGGELGELRTPVQQAWPGISNHLLPRIEACTKPVIAAVHGFAIGGGLELALACHYRVAHRGTRIALPEKKHGVLPPSGSQRMPRAVGVQRSLELIISGETVPVDTFADTALIDGWCDSEVIATALEFAAALAPAASPAQALLRHRPMQTHDAPTPLAAWRERLAGMPDASVAMQRCIDAVEWSVQAPDFDAGLAAAKRLHDELAQRLRCDPRRGGAP